MNQEVDAVIVAVTNIKGGVGKTTTAIALACAAAKSGHPAAVLDADPQGSSTEWALTADELGESLPFDVRSANIASIRRLKHDEGWVLVDCPPSGAVTDEAVAKADFVVVPTTPAPVDLAKTWDTVEVLESQGKAYGVLLTKAQPQTLSFRSARAELEESEVSTFEVTIPKREAVVNRFGHPFDGNLFGYDEALREIEEAMRHGD